MQYARLNEDGTFLEQCPSGNIVWDESNFCTTEALVRDGKADQFRVVPLIETPPPDYDPATHKVSRDGYEFSEDNWRYKWRVDELTQEELDQRTVAQWSAIRSERNTKLSACDWTQLDDTPLSNTQKQAWATYRQALRDITLQPDPFAIEWPVAP
jgi:hypothetical protein